jgi:diguanylate cyclase (GGDEF)-like protein
MRSSAHAPARGGFRGLAARIGYFVFAATLLSALAVAATSAHALRAFLRSKVEQKVPGALVEVRERLELWYKQRALDVQVFAHSEVVVDALGRMARAGGKAGSHDRSELEQYLGYVQLRLPDYASIFVLDADGRLVLGVGALPPLDAGVARRLASAAEGSVSEPLPGGEGRSVQVVSSPVSARGGRPLFSLHATLPLARLQEQLGATATELGRLLILDPRGACVTPSRPLPSGTCAASPEIADAAPGEVRDYVAADGVRVVGSALAFPRFEWTLVIEEDYETAFAPIAQILRRTAALNLGIVLGLSAMVFAVVASMVRPLRMLSACAQRLRDGEQSVELPVVERSDEVGVLTRSFAEMVASLQRAHESLEHLAITDGLTKIHNHRYFQDQLERHIKRADRTGAPLALVLMDLDDFKQLNDRWGHAAGDCVLERVAALLVDQTRDHDLVARYGGEEFAILAPDTDRDGARGLAEKLRLAIVDRPILVTAPADPIAITASFGVATYRGDGKAFFQAADDALYAAKAAGKDCVVVSDAKA